MSVKLEFDATSSVLAIGLPADSTGDEYYDNFTAIPITQDLARLETLTLPPQVIVVVTLT
jgi:hypothetical protein